MFYLDWPNTVRGRCYNDCGTSMLFMTIIDETHDSVSIDIDDVLKQGWDVDRQANVLTCPKCQQQK